MTPIRDWQLIYSTLATSLFTDGISSIHRQHFVYSQMAFHLFTDSFSSILCRLLVYSQTAFCLFSAGFPSTRRRRRVYTQTAPYLHADGAVSTRRRRRIYTQTAPCLHADGAMSTRRRRRVYMQTAPCLHADGAVSTCRRRRVYSGSVSDASSSQQTSADATPTQTDVSSSPWTTVTAVAQGHHSDVGQRAPPHNNCQYATLSRSLRFLQQTTETFPRRMGQSDLKIKKIWSFIGCS